MKSRGYQTNFDNTDIFDNIDSKWYNDYKPTNKAIKINIERNKARTK